MLIFAKELFLMIEFSSVLCHKTLCQHQNANFFKGATFTKIYIIVCLTKISLFLKKHEFSSLSTSQTYLSLSDVLSRVGLDVSSVPMLSEIHTISKKMKCKRCTFSIRIFAYMWLSLILYKMYEPADKICASVSLFVEVIIVLTVTEGII